MTDLSPVEKARQMAAAQKAAADRKADLATGYHDCPCGAWGCHTFDFGRTWFCDEHKPEGRK